MRAGDSLLEVLSNLKLNRHKSCSLWQLEKSNVFLIDLFITWLDIWKSWNVQYKKNLELAFYVRTNFFHQFLHANKLFPSILELAFRFGVYQVHSVAHFIWVCIGYHRLLWPPGVSFYPGCQSWASWAQI